MKIRKRVFVGCEGESERSYAKWLQSVFDQAGLWVSLDAQVARGGDPLSVVQASAKLAAKRERAHGRFWLKAVFFDTDKLGVKPQRDQQIPALIAKMGAYLVTQEFDHEALLLRHLKGCQSLRPPAGVSLNALRGKWPEYRKPCDALMLGKKIGLPNLTRARAVEPELDALLLAIGLK